MRNPKNLLDTIRKCGVDVEFAMDWVCMNYSTYAREVLHEFELEYKVQQQVIREGFRLLFTHIHQFDTNHPDLVAGFKNRIRLMMICSLVAYGRSHNRLETLLDFDSNNLRKATSYVLFDTELLSIDTDSVLAHFSASRRLVLNLCLMHGFGENELALSLGLPQERARSLYGRTLNCFKSLVYQQAEQIGSGLIKA